MKILSKSKYSSFLTNHLYNIHFIGIGGSGMSSLAQVLFYQGHKISGSDIQKNKNTKQLSSLGIKIYFQHNKKNIKNSNIVVCSAAIPSNNIEIIYAKKNNIQVISRLDMLYEIMRLNYSIAVTGTHGKTTTTAIISNIFLDSKLDPTIISGSNINFLGRNSYIGKSKYVIAEIDESNDSFLLIRPIVSIITNIDCDHIDNYQNNFDNLIKTFLKFLNSLPFYGYSIVCIDDLIIFNNILKKTERKVITYGFNIDSDFRIVEYQLIKNKTYFSVIRKNKPTIKIKLNLLGKHNVLNATAAIAVATQEGISDKNIINSLSKFQGIERRFEILGNFFLKSPNNILSNILLIHDYGHHPTSINITLKTIKSSWPQKKIIMIFQPHRYTRTLNLHKEFVYVLSKVNVLLLLNVYESGENYISEADSISLYNDMKTKFNKSNIFLISDNKKIFEILFPFLVKDNVIIIQGAGDIEYIAQKIKKILKILNFNS